MQRPHGSHRIGWSAGNRRGLSAWVVPQLVGPFSCSESRHGAAQTMYFRCAMTVFSSLLGSALTVPHGDCPEDEQVGGDYAGFNRQDDDQGIHDNALVVI